MKVVEIFESIQGEGAYAGTPVLFIRLAGCTRECSFCDTQYHKEGKDMKIDDIIKTINQSKMDIVVWTGGEPMLQIRDILTIVPRVQKEHHLETNGDILPPMDIFSYICFSPKTEIAAMNINTWASDNYDDIDVKVVYDGSQMYMKLIPYATMLMPLTVKDEEMNKKIRQKVWKYCQEQNIKYSPRLHFEVWGSKRGV